MGSDPQSYLQAAYDYELKGQRILARALRNLRDGVDAADLHCDPVPISSSWRYVIDKALKDAGEDT